MVPFRTISLGKPDVTEIISVTDSLGDRYYEVQSLTNDTVFLRTENSRKDQEFAPERLKLHHAAKRYVVTRSSVTGLTTLRFGGGDETQFDEDIIPDPSEHAITLFGDRESVSTLTLDPNDFLKTQTLGISPRNTTLTIRYRTGGGIRHNVPAGTINSVKTLTTAFRTATPTAIATAIRASLVVFNENSAAGGEEEPSLEELRLIATLNRNAQNRIVTREDLIARVYTMPSNFGRVFRASVRDNPNNPQAAQLYIISRDSDGLLLLSPDTLKENLAKFLSKFRLISDAIDILDAKIINLGINYSVTIENDKNPDIVLSIINAKIIEYFELSHWQIDQPLIVSELETIISMTDGVSGLIEFDVVGKSGVLEGLQYSNVSFDVKRHMDRNFIFPPTGGIFELKFPIDDVIGRMA